LNTGCFDGLHGDFIAWGEVGLGKLVLAHEQNSCNYRTLFQRVDVG